MFLLLIILSFFLYLFIVFLYLSNNKYHAMGTVGMVRVSVDMIFKCRIFLDEVQKSAFYVNLCVAAS